MHRRCLAGLLVLFLVLSLQAYIAMMTIMLFARSQCRPWPSATFSDAMSLCFGIHERKVEYSGKVMLVNMLEEAVIISFRRSSEPQQELSIARLHAAVEPSHQHPPQLHVSFMAGNIHCNALIAGTYGNPTF